MASLNLISPAENQNRIRIRFQEAMTSFSYDRGRSTSIPRLPDPDITAIIRRNKKIYSQIQKLINMCNPDPKGSRHLTKNRYGICNGLGIDLLFIFDQDAISKEELAQDRNYTLVEPVLIPLSKRARELTKITAADDPLVQYTAKVREMVNQRFTDLLRTDRVLLREAAAAAAAAADAGDAAAAGGGGAAAAGDAADAGGAAAAGGGGAAAAAAAAAVPPQPPPAQDSISSFKQFMRAQGLPKMAQWKGGQRTRVRKKRKNRRKVRTRRYKKKKSKKTRRYQRKRQKRTRGRRR